MILISGSSNKTLARATAKLLDLDLGSVDVSKFPNGEKRVWIRQDLTGQDVTIIQSFSEPVDEHIIELALLSDAAHHLGSGSITALVPWLGYSPQDKSFRPGEPVSVHVVAKIIEAVGINRFTTVDIHSSSSLDHFHIPVTHLTALPLFTDYFRTKDLKNYSIVAVDKGALNVSKSMAAALKLPLIVFNKTRDLATGAVALTHKSGAVKGQHIIAIDDFVSTGSTRITASRILKSLGALSYTDCITHALLAGDSPQQLQASSIDQIITTDTYSIPQSKRFPKLTVLSAAPLLADSIRQHLSL